MIIKTGLKRLIYYFIGINFYFISNAKENSNHFSQNNYIHGFHFNPKLIRPISLEPVKKYGLSDFENGASFYPALDYKLEEETIVHAAARGKVIISGRYKDENVVVIQSGYFFTIYKGIQEFYVKKGSVVKPFQMIGKSLNKLSFEVRDLNGNAYNPENYFSKIKSIYVKQSLEKSKLYQSFISFMELHGFKKNEIHTMYCIASWESSLNPIAINRNKNGTQDTGLFQINDVWLKRCGMTRRDLVHVQNNANCAHVVLEEQGFKAWVTYNKYRNRC